MFLALKKTDCYGVKNRYGKGKKDKKTVFGKKVAVETTCAAD